MIGFTYVLRNSAWWQPS